MKLTKGLPSISSMFYKQLIRSQILNAPKRKSSWQCCLALLGPTSVKAARKTLMKLTPQLCCPQSEGVGESKFPLLNVDVPHYHPSRGQFYKTQNTVKLQKNQIIFFNKLDYLNNDNTNV